MQKGSIEASISCIFQGFSIRCRLVGVFVNTIDILSQLRSLSNYRFQEIPVAQRPRKPLEQVRDAISSIPFTSPCGTRRTRVRTRALRSKGLVATPQQRGVWGLPLNRMMVNSDPRKKEAGYRAQLPSCLRLLQCPQGTSNARHVAILAGLTTLSEGTDSGNGLALDRLTRRCYNLS